MEARSLIHFAVWGGADQRGALHRTKGRAGLPSTLKGWTCLTFKLQSLSDLLGQHTHFTGWESRCKNEWGSDLSKATLMIQKRWLPNMPASSPPDPSHKSLPQAPALIPLARLSPAQHPVLQPTPQTTKTSFSHSWSYSKAHTEFFYWGRGTFWINPRCPNSNS